METLWRKDLRIADVISCRGVGFTARAGVPIVRWLDADGAPLANDCAWGSLPAEGFLVRIDS